MVPYFLMNRRWYTMREKINFKSRVNEKPTLNEGFKKFIATKKAM